MTMFSYLNMHQGVAGSIIEETFIAGGNDLLYEQDIDVIYIKLKPFHLFGCLLTAKVLQCCFLRL